MYAKHADEEIIMACFFSNDLLYTGKQCYFNRENIQRVAKELDTLNSGRLLVLKVSKMKKLQFAHKKKKKEKKKVYFRGSWPNLKMEKCNPVAAPMDKGIDLRRILMVSRYTTLF